MTYAMAPPGGQHTEDRLVLLKKLLREASPRNPTYILGRIIADFRAQTKRELTVQQGDEVFILFEIDDWAFATLLSDTARKGYVPLDYCDIIIDFYEKSPKSKVRCPTYQPKTPQIQEKKELCYYEKKLKQYPQSSRIKHRDNSLLLNTRCDDNFQCVNELYAEKTTPTRSPRQRMDGGKECCCCCEKRRCRGSRQDKYDDVLDYLRKAETQPAESHCDDSESGLGDSESILSFSDPHSSKPHVDLSDMSTQTSQSLEDLRKQLDFISADLDLTSTEIHLDRLSRSCHASPIDKSTPAPHQSCGSQSKLSTKSSSPSESDLDDSESYSSFDREDYDTVKRNDRGNPNAKTKSMKNPSHLSSRVKSSPSNKSTNHNAPEVTSLPIPCLEKGTVPNKVELSHLSHTIKDKLKPTRDELLHKRTKTPLPTIPERADNSPSPSIDCSSQLTKMAEEEETCDQREMTLRSIQEQYMKLEEARLLHNALKHLNDTMHATELLESSYSA